MHHLRLLILFVLFCTHALCSVANAEPDGRDIAVEADRRISGFGDYQARILMILRNATGQESIREMEMSVYETPGKGDKTLIFFNSPPDIRGTALLTHTHGGAPDDQWLFLPSVMRVTRIASDNQSGPFVGSEFAYEDMGSTEVDNYRYRFLREDVVDGETMFVIERYPLNRASGYKRQVVWIDKSEYRPRRIEYYNRADLHFKTLLLNDYRLHVMRFWRSHRMLMTNHQTGKSSLLSWENIDFGVGLRQSDFNPRALTR